MITNLLQWHLHVKNPHNIDEITLGRKVKSKDLCLSSNMAIIKGDDLKPNFQKNKMTTQDDQLLKNSEITSLEKVVVHDFHDEKIDEKSGSNEDADSCVAIDEFEIELH